MTQITGDTVHWMNIFNLVVCIAAAVFLWMTVVLRQHSEQPMPKYIQIGCVLLALTYAYSAASFFGTYAGIKGAPDEKAVLTTAQISWMVRNVIITGMAFCGMVTAWKFAKSDLKQRYRTNHGLYATQGKSAAQIPVLSVSERA